MAVAFSIALPVSAESAAADDTATGAGAGQIENNIFLGCPGDCDDSGGVDVVDILAIVSVALAAAPPEICPAMVDEPSVVEITQAVTFALLGCPEVVRLRLRDGSRIVHTAAPDEPVVAEDLTGRMVFVYRSFDLVDFRYELTDLQFEGDGFDIAASIPASSGRLDARQTEPTLALVRADVLINDVEVPLVGRSLVECCPPRLSTLDVIELCGPSTDATACNRIRDGTEAGYSLFLYLEPGR